MLAEVGSASVTGWLILITKPPFEVGDRIQIGDH